MKNPLAGWWLRWWAAAAEVGGGNFLPFFLAISHVRSLADGMKRKKENTSVFWVAEDVVVVVVVKK